jgi:superfamily I DNA/RNA helicase
VEEPGLNPADLDAGENEAYANGRGQKFYALYQARLQALNACDFGDLLLHMLNVFRREREVLEQYQQRFKYVMVDEYQDTNAVQYLWLRLIAQARKNICVVGDDDQSIYSWRGAEVANILRFEKDFPGAKVIRLEQNYRSTPHILGAASGLIAENSERLGKTLWTEQNGGDKVRVVGVWDGPEEARRVGDEIERLEREGCRSTRSPFWCARSSRRANWKTASSRSVWLSHRRRLPLLRTRRNPRCAGLSAPDRLAIGRSGVRADLQHAQAWAGRQDAGKAPPPCPRARRAAVAGGGRNPRYR